MQRLALCILAIAFSVACWHAAPKTSPASMPNSTSAEIQRWVELQRAETEWLASFAPRSNSMAPPRPRLQTPPTASELIRDTRDRISHFDNAYTLLRHYIDGIAPNTPAHARALFRLGLYADIRLRFESRHSLATFLDPFGFVPPPAGLSEEIARDATLAATYRDPMEIYAAVASEVAQGVVLWAGVPLRGVVQRVIALQPSVDVDVAHEGHDILAEAAEHDIRNQVLELLNADTFLP